MECKVTGDIRSEGSIDSVTYLQNFDVTLYTISFIALSMNAAEAHWMVLGLQQQRTARVQWWFGCSCWCQKGCQLSEKVLVGKILLPIPYIMGVNPDQCEHVAKLIGIKLSLNEFIAYEELGKMKKIGLLTPRSEAMATFALCSFANPGSLACFIAVLVSLCPNQKENVGRVAFRALISGATTSLLTACVAEAASAAESAHGFPSSFQSSTAD
ncbi:hypothetical protein LSTR_LSTR016667 [Laodelphax striatellus]|uniref:Concentrative nucleoside transporter C-terminal domain-containing protein n=1 Tax=Laodelphax striatellus TaxID=195883 RepID=A0A482XFW3_LAOST|nr:hypothetical protein LSTR_LSTR016667 [Laodelphax striatellus]